MAELDAETIQQQQELLAQYRRTLAHLLHQAAQFSAGHLPAHVANGIDDARAEISRIKTVLRVAGVFVSDGPSDTDSTPRIDSQAAHDTYLRWLIERNMYLDERGTYQTQRQVQLKLNEIYVSLRAQRDTPEVDRRLLEQELAAIEQQLANAALSAEEAEERRDQLLGLDTRHQRRDAPSTPIELAEVVTRHDKLIILGDPGSGKTTLLRYLALKHAEALRDGLPDAGDGLGLTRFPILLHIAAYAESGAWRTRSLSDFFTEYYRHQDCPSAGLHDLLETMLASGTCLILLDGLDEVVNADERRGVVQQIENFVRRHDNTPNRFVITSRIAGYRGAPLGVPFAHYIVRDMDDAQISRFLERWCVAVERTQTPDISSETRTVTARREIDSILSAVKTNPGVRRLAANPLLLRTLALIHRTSARLPQKRIELYKQAADTLARTWRPAQGVAETVLVKDEYLTPLLSKLAYWLHFHKPTGIATEREVYRVLGEEWARMNRLAWDPDNPDPAITEEVKHFLLKVREHTGLFVERAPRRYGFMHLTFEEYYVARYLVARSRTRAKLIRTHLHDPRWDEPILLAIGFVGLEFPAEVTELVELAILAEGEDAGPPDFVPSRHEELLGRDYLFALRCLGDDIPLRPWLIRQLVDRFATELLHRGGSARFRPYHETLERRLTRLRGSATAALLLPHLAEALQDPDRTVRIRAVEALGNQWVDNSQVLALLREALQDEDSNVRHWAVHVLSQNGRAGSEEITLLRAMLHGAEANMRLLALGALERMGVAGSEEVAVLHLLLQDADPNVRIRAVQLFGHTKGAESEQMVLLSALLQDADPSVRIQVVQVLRKLDVMQSEVFALLRAALHDSDPKVRIATVDLLMHKAVSPQVLTLLHTVLQDAEMTVRVRAVGALRRLGAVGPEAIAVLCAALQDADPNVRIQAVQALTYGGIPQSEEMALIQIALQDGEMTVRIPAMQALGRMRMAGPEVVRLLHPLLQDTDPNMRYWAVEALGSLGTAMLEVVSLLQAALQDTDADVRIHAVEHLGYRARAEPEARVALHEALQHTDPDVRIMTIDSLARLGEVGSEARAVLEMTIHGAEVWSMLSNVADVIGQSGAPDEATLDALYAGFSDSDSEVRTACATALVRLSQRYPDVASDIEQKLLQAIDDPVLDDGEDDEGYRAYDYVFDALWMLVSNEPPA